jgi:hypothetical protein
MLLGISFKPLTLSGSSRRVWLFGLVFLLDQRYIRLNYFKLRELYFMVLQVIMNLVILIFML